MNKRVKKGLYHWHSNPEILYLCDGVVLLRIHNRDFENEWHTSDLQDCFLWREGYRNKNFVFVGN